MLAACFWGRDEPIMVLVFAERVWSLVSQWFDVVEFNDLP